MNKDIKLEPVVVLKDVVVLSKTSNINTPVAGREIINMNKVDKTPVFFGEKDILSISKDLFLQNLERKVPLCIIIDDLDDDIFTNSFYSFLKNVKKLELKILNHLEMLDNQFS